MNFGFGNFGCRFAFLLIQGAQKIQTSHKGRSRTAADFFEVLALDEGGSLPGLSSRSEEPNPSDASSTSAFRFGMSASRY